MIEYHKRTGDLMPALTHFGAAAHPVSRGIRRGRLATVITITFRRAVQPSKGHAPCAGAERRTFTSRDTDFLVSNSPDFHPTDVLEDADGSLLVIDTGAWYKLCCPTSQLDAPEVLGAIYRVRRQGAPRLDDPRGRKLAWRTMPPPELAQLLDDVRPAVANRAIQVLAALGSGAVPTLDEVLRTPPSADAERNTSDPWTPAQCRWALTRIERATAR